MKVYFYVTLLLAPWLSAAGGEAVQAFSAADRSWWAVQPLRDPAVPAQGEGWARNAIDRFIARGLETAGFTPAPEAEREERLRRACQDLHGLPPTPEQHREFVTDTRPDAWPRLVQQLLDSPRYGERWAQHWLDVVRYADSDGYRQDAYRPDAWRYRDYVIRAFNRDKAYDRFVREQLAGDEIDRNDPDALVATGFLRNGIYEYNQRNARMHWELIVNEMTDVTGEVFLGLGIGCAQCHDHKFDPILQKDYFAFQSFLASVSWPRDVQLGTAEQHAEQAKQQQAWEAATATIRAELDPLLEETMKGKRSYSVKQFPEDIQAMYHKPPAERTPYEAQMAMLVDLQVDWQIRPSEVEKKLKGKTEKYLRYQELRKQLEAFDHLKPKPLPTGFVASDVGTQAARTWLKTRDGKQEVQPAFLTLLGQDAPKIQPTASTTGRRSALADWIVQPDNPLTARVMVNRIWQRHFGRGLVPTPNDFGLLGEEPSHPELLDWLATRFVQGGWKIKDLHTLIMDSATYRQTARREPSPAIARHDPGNRLLWRFPPMRLDAEQVRDAMLAVSGELKQREGGPPVGGESSVRSIYVKKMRNSPDPVLAGFDAPLGFDSAPDRIATTTPTQSLMLINGDWTLKRSSAFARRLLGAAKQPEPGHIRQAYRLAYGREAERGEVEAALAFLREQGPVAQEALAARDPFPNETGLRPIAQAFPGIEELDLGERALWLQPGSRFQSLHWKDIALSEDAFTIEAVARLENLHKDASVNTLLSRWNGNHRESGWTFGVTSEKSRYQPRNFIMQLVGDNFQGTPVYEVVASNLRFPLNKPVYFAAAVSAQRQGENTTQGTVTFYMKDLSDPKAKLEQVTVQHDVVGKVQLDAVKALISGRDRSSGHLWDGQLARLVVSRGALGPEQLLLGKTPGGERLFDSRFDSDHGEEPEAGTAWIRAKPAAAANTPLLGAMTDFCHALFNSNEFLYLH